MNRHSRRTLLSLGLAASVAAFDDANGFGRLGAEMGRLGAQNLIAGGGAAPFVATGLPNWQAAVRNVLSGSANATMFMAGDSTTRAAVSSVGNWGIASPPAILSGLLNPAIPASCNNFIADGAIGGISANDSRVTGFAGWAQTGPTTAGGTSFIASSAATFSFAPGVAFDRIEVRWVSFGGAGATITVDIGGSTLATIDTSTVPTSGTSKINTQTVNCSLGTNTANIKWGAGTIILIGLNCYNSATKQVLVFNDGWSGSTSTTWNTGAAVYQPVGAIGRADHILTTINLGINDWNAGTVLATFQTNIQALITSAKQSGAADVLLVTPNTTNNTANIATQATYVAVLQALAVSNSVKLLDLWTNVFGGAVQPSLMADTLHPNTAGIAAIAAAYKTALTT